MKVTYLLLTVLGLASSGCGHDAGKSGALIHEPPIKELTSDKLRLLAKTCQNYVADKSAQGPYDAAYCQSAINSWKNVPLQAAGISAPVLMADPQKP